MNKQIFFTFLVLGLVALTLAGKGKKSDGLQSRNKRDTASDAKKLGDDLKQDAKNGFRSAGNKISEVGQDVANAPANIKNEAKELENDIENAPDAAADAFGRGLSNLGNMIQDRK